MTDTPYVVCVVTCVPRWVSEPDKASEPPQSALKQHSAEIAY